MHKLDNTPFAIVITSNTGEKAEPVGMYRGRSYVRDDDTIAFESLDGQLELDVPHDWLKSIRSVPDAIAEDLGHAEYFITVDAEEWG